MSKTKKKIVFDSENLLFYALCGDDPCIQSRTSHVLKPVRWDKPKENRGTIHSSNHEHLLVVKAQRKNDPEPNEGTIHASNQEPLQSGGGGAGQ